MIGTHAGDRRLRAAILDRAFGKPGGRLLLRLRIGRQFGGQHHLRLFHAVQFRQQLFRGQTDRAVLRNAILRHFQHETDALRRDDQRPHQTGIGQALSAHRIDDGIQRGQHGFAVRMGHGLSFREAIKRPPHRPFVPAFKVQNVPFPPPFIFAGRPDRLRQVREGAGLGYAHRRHHPQCRFDAALCRCADSDGAPGRNGRIPRAPPALRPSRRSDPVVHR